MELVLTRAQEMELTMMRWKVVANSCINLLGVSSEALADPSSPPSWADLQFQDVLATTEIWSTDRIFDLIVCCWELHSMNNFHTANGGRSQRTLFAPQQLRTKCDSFTKSVGKCPIPIQIRSMEARLD